MPTLAHRSAPREPHPGANRQSNDRLWIDRLWIAAHTERAANIAYKVALRLGFPDPEAVRLGGKLHDLGKYLLPQRIFNMRKRPTIEDTDSIRTHPEIGYWMARRIPGVGPIALTVILYHHERLDGSGYPFGLEGSEIPWAARIFAVADVWDALVSPRPYKPAWTSEDARKELLRYAGRTLDEEAVEALLMETSSP